MMFGYKLIHKKELTKLKALAAMYKGMAPRVSLMKDLAEQVKSLVKEIESQQEELTRLRDKQQGYLETIQQLRDKC